ncbi:MAG: RcnB family protein [Caulobacterales bacterium]
MKKIITSALAATMMLGSMAVAPGIANARPNNNDHRYERSDSDWKQDKKDWKRDARYDNHRWRKGERLPSYYRTHYRAVDYRAHHFKAPPRGYHYVRDDRGDYLLVGIATGAILGVILANN